MDEFGGKKDFLCDLYGMKGSRRVASWFSTGVMVSIAVFKQLLGHTHRP